jgi:hypothetical protein
MQRTLFLLLFMLMFGAGYSAPGQPKLRKLVLATDTGVVALRQLDKGAIGNYKKQPEFNYHEEKYNGPSLWSRFWKWFWSLFDSVKVTKTAWFWVVIKYLFIGAGIAALLFLILKLSGIDINIFRSKPYAPLAYSEFEENIHEIDFDTEVEKAAAVNNYRLAVRLLYLKVLKQLSDNGLINWQINKTNTHYASELTNTEQQAAFKQLTRQFEYVWYGDFLINSDIYKKISPLFQNFKTDTK